MCSSQVPAVDAPMYCVMGNNTAICTVKIACTADNVIPISALKLTRFTFFDYMHAAWVADSQRPPSAQSRGQPAAAPIHNACKTSRKKKSKKDFSASAADSTMSTAMHGDHKRRRKWKKVAVAQHGRETTARSVSIVSNQESEATRSRRLRAERRAGGYKKAAKKAAKKRSSGKSSNKKTTAQRWANSNGAASTKNSWKKKKNAGSKQ
eukprot:m.911880 g.911880  ORF g.911880 m.911880 type:complete len:208 (-) comp23725_c0_seq35:1351-1974(-)